VHDDHASAHRDDGHGDHVAQYRRLFWLMLLLAIPTVAASGMFAMIVGNTRPDIPGACVGVGGAGDRHLRLGARPFLTGAVSEIRSRAMGMMLLIGLAIPWWWPRNHDRGFCLGEIGQASRSC
jgi:Cu2+-exporting ATPase